MNDRRAMTWRAMRQLDLCPECGKVDTYPHDPLGATGEELRRGIPPRMPADLTHDRIMHSEARRQNHRPAPGLAPLRRRNSDDLEVR